MALQSYKNQVMLLLDVLPEIAKEDCFALHGGTAINLFVQNMPRLSVDIDLTYLPIENRETSLQNISSALERIKSRIQKVSPDISVNEPSHGKLQFSKAGAFIKLEVNTIIRGQMEDIRTLELCPSAQNEFGVYVQMPIVSTGQLYGGKICAALDRQHPRDLFDVKHLLAKEGINEKIKKGYLFTLLSSNRPLHELIQPHFKDQRDTMENQFDGMTNEEFRYEEFESTRRELVQEIRAQLTDVDKIFLTSFINLQPDWSIYDFENFPSIQWKLQNLTELKEKQPNKYNTQVDMLQNALE